METPQIPGYRNQENRKMLEGRGGEGTVKNFRMDNECSDQNRREGRERRTRSKQKVGVGER